MIEAFAELQHAFAAAVRGLPAELPLRAATVARAESGLAVYRNNVMSGLIKVVAARFPSVRRLLGEDRFLDSVRRFIAAEPPDHVLLLDPRFDRGRISWPSFATHGCLEERRSYRV